MPTPNRFGKPATAMNLLLTYCLVVLYGFGNQLQAPLEPFLVERLVGQGDTSASASYGRLQSLYWGIQIVGSFLFGCLLDKVGVRLGFGLNFLCCAATYSLQSAAGSMAALYASKIPGIGMNGVLCAQTAVSQFTDPGPERFQALGRLTTAYTVGGVIGPYLGGLLGARGGHGYILGAKVATGSALLAAFGSGLLASPTQPQEPRAFQGERLPLWQRLGTVANKAGFVLVVKLLTSVANAVASSTLNLVLKNELGFAEADLGLFLSAQFACGAVANAVLLGPASRLLGGRPSAVVRNCVAALAVGYGLQAAALNVGGLMQLTPSLRRSTFIGIALSLALFQYSLATSITAESTELVPKAMKGTLLGMEHCLFSAARAFSPAIGIGMLDDYGTWGLYGSCSSILLATYLLWITTYEQVDFAAGKRIR
ncbi:tetA [Symbiodinium sp. CCMP2456]|nr:tetA [Symbiodinium sp. CCMP2456]